MVLVTSHRPIFSSFCVLIRKLGGEASLDQLTASDLVGVAATDQSGALKRTQKTLIMLTNYSVEN